MTNVSPEADKERAWIEDHQHHHHRGEVVNAATPSSSELPASIMTSGFTGHEHVEPEYEVEIPPPTERVGLKLIVPFAFAQMALFIALLGPIAVSRLPRSAVDLCTHTNVGAHGPPRCTGSTGPSRAT